MHVGAGTHSPFFLFAPDLLGLLESKIQDIGSREKA